MFEAVPRLALRRLGLLGEPLDRRFERGAHDIRNCPWRCNMPLSGVHHIRNDRASYARSESPVDGFDAFRANRASSPGATLGARRAHSASLNSSASLVTARNCSPLRSPSYATAATAGNDSSARAVSSLSRTVRPTHRWSQRRIDLPTLVEHPQHRELLVAQPTLLTHQHVELPAQPIRRPAPQLVEVIGDVEHAPIKTQGYDTHPPSIRYRRTAHPVATSSSRRALSAGWSATCT